MLLQACGCYTYLNVVPVFLTFFSVEKKVKLFDWVYGSTDGQAEATSSQQQLHGLRAIFSEVPQVCAEHKATQLFYNASSDFCFRFLQQL